MKLAKNKKKGNKTLRLNFCYFKIIYIVHPRYHRKIKGRTLKNKQQKQACLHEIIQLIIMKMETKKKNR